MRSDKVVLWRDSIFRMITGKGGGEFASVIACWVSVPAGSGAGVSRAFIFLPGSVIAYGVCDIGR